MQTTSSDQTNLHLKVLTCQISPKFKDIDHNIKRAEEFLSKYTDKDEFDVVLFPETAFTGYCFTSKDDIRPYLEEAGKGKTFELCASTAKRLNCYVICGYPELYIDSTTKEEHMYNSAYVIDRQGGLIHNYKKYYMYDIDYFWAKEGPGFQTIKLKNTKGIEFKAVVAICMDIEPYEMKNVNEFKLAEFCREEEIDALFLLCAWPDREPNDPRIRTGEEVINYWVNIRMHLMLQHETDKSRYHRKWAFFCANRVGTEGDTTFVGSSCAFKCNPLEKIGSLDTMNEGFLLADITL